MAKQPFDKENAVSLPLLDQLIRQYRPRNLFNSLDSRHLNI